MIEQHKKTKLPLYILGTAYKKDINLDVGSPAILLKNILIEQGYIDVVTYDPYIDKKKPDMGKGIYLIGTNHSSFYEYDFPSGSIILDPWAIIPEKEDIIVNHIGRTK